MGEAQQLLLDDAVGADRPRDRDGLGVGGIAVREMVGVAAGQGTPPAWLSLARSAATVTAKCGRVGGEALAGGLHDSDVGARGGGPFGRIPPARSVQAKSGWSAAMR
ncbi:hypothetical protein IU434_09855 [Nocardia farcinica]|uniref:hypothetical protein n=1 Tax=Nocardia farcinica TaxID=37329 RepID=UPI0018959B95|nr:hypothetical protein [Nocardia farcinica]MBF6442321.1 hypothetical protein [Nocardia farcinica]